ncbi:MAG: VOC family protein [Gemmatimonadota bacterium]
MPIDTNSFCWNGIVSTDADAARSFYADVIGWVAVDHTFPSGETTTMFFTGETARGHLRAPQSEGEPNHWTSYLRVDDVAASVASAEASAGGVLVPATDIDPGTFAAVTSPSGIVLCLFHEADEASAENAPAGVGSVNWTELQSRDIEADLPWLKAAFGFELSEMEIPNGTYYMLNSGGKPRGGAVAAFREEIAGRWLAWIQTDDIDEAVGRVTAGGGSVVAQPFVHPGVGRLAMVADPTGATFGLIAPD